MKTFSGVRAIVRAFVGTGATAVLSMAFLIHASAQNSSYLSLKAAVDLGVNNHPAIKAKGNYLSAAEAVTKNARKEYLPNVIASAQQSYGTINGQFGPMAPVGALGVASAGPVNAEQRWNSGFGAAYIISTNWEVFSFGRARSRVRLGQAQTERESTDLEQTQFIHKVRVASAYLNLLIARQLLSSSQANLERVRTIQQSVKARTLSGLNPGVDSSLVNSEVSRAKLSVLEFVNNEQVVQQQLADLLNVSAENRVDPDTLYYSTLPQIDRVPHDIQANPQLRFFRSRVDYASQVAEVARKSIFPGLTVFGVYQARASGFTNSYNPETSDGYSSSYWDGVSPSRYNYVAGISLSWNLISPLKTKQQVRAQRFVAAGFQNEYEQLDRELQNQVVLSDQRIENSLQTAHEAPVQYQAASEAYLQKSVLYKNGLTTIVDLQQALYALNRAEIDQSVAFINVWNALLMKAAATGDFDLFINQVR